MTRFGILVLVLVAILGPESSLSSQASQQIKLHFKNSAHYGTAGDVGLKTVTLRRVMKSVPKERIEYAKLEIWLSNTELDACAQPELGEVSALPLKSPEEFVLVWQAANVAKPGTTHLQTPVGQAVFGDQWPTRFGRPVVLAWGHGWRQALGEVFNHEPVTLELPFWDKGPSEWLFGKRGARGFSKGKEEEFGFTLVQVIGQTIGPGPTAMPWIFFQADSRLPRHKDYDYYSMLTRGEGGAPRLRFRGNQARRLWADGDIEVSRVCPDIIHEKRFWVDGKIYPR